MTAMFPDSGVPPLEARNSIPDPDTQHCNELWYSTMRCTPRFDPAAANAVLAELVNLINKGEVSYDCNFLDQVQLAVRYLTQRGLMSGALASVPGVMNTYSVTLDPPATRYNDYMTLRLVPTVSNTGAVILNLNSLGDWPLLRNDGQPLQQFDLLAGIPFECVRFQNAWYMVGLCKSQIPVKKTGVVDGWIRTDGSDVTGDGTENTPAKAFRTIQHAYEAIGDRYAPSPNLTINLRLGVPGTYAGAALGPYGGRIQLTGDVNSRSNYKITVAGGGGAGTNFDIAALSTTLRCEGVTFLLDQADNGLPFNCTLSSASSVLMLDNCQWDVLVDNPLRGFLCSANIASGLAFGGTCIFNGNNHTIGLGIALTRNSQMLGPSTPQQDATLQFNNCKWNPGTGAGFISSMLSTWTQGAIGYNKINVISAGCTGTRYGVDYNSMMNLLGQTAPGDSAGTVSTGGQFTP